MLNILNKFVQFRRGLREFIVLLLISKHEVPFYGKELIDFLSETEFAVSEKSFYKIVKELKESHLIYVHIDEIESGGARKCYFITERGKKYIKSLEKYWKLISAQITSFATSDHDVRW